MLLTLSTQDMGRNGTWTDLDPHTVDFTTSTLLDTDVDQNQGPADVDNRSMDVSFDEEDLDTRDIQLDSQMASH